MIADLTCNNVDLFLFDSVMERIKFDKRDKAYNPKIYANSTTIIRIKEEISLNKEYRKKYDPEKLNFINDEKLKRNIIRME